MEVCSKVDCQVCRNRQKSVFSGLTEEELSILRDAKMCYKFSKGEAVFEKGKHPQGLFCVLEGKIKIASTDKNGKEQIISLAKNGDIVGYKMLLSNDKYYANCVTLEDSTLCYLPKAVFLQVVESSQKLKGNLLELLSTDAQRAELKIASLASMPAKQRIAKALIYLIDSFGYEPGNTTINVSLSREEIASIAGTTRETTSRILLALAEKRIIELNAKKIRILILKKLLAASEDI